MPGRTAAHSRAVRTSQHIINKIMQQSLSRQQVTQRAREYFKRIMDEARASPFLLNLALTNNPFLKGRDSFKFLLAQLKQYNVRVERAQVRDPYEMLSFQKMHSMLSDLAQIETREDQLTSLQEISTWFKEQQRLVQQRFDQGYIRYEMSRQYREALKYLPEKQEPPHQEQLEIPFYMIERIIEPYRQKSRSLHSEYENPSRRLQDYKVKTLNILNLASSEGQKEESRPPRVLYPMPPKYEEPKEEPPEATPEAQPATGDLPPEGAAPAEEAVPQQPEVDMGGLGEEPGEPQEDEPPEEVPDKLRPLNPIYVSAVKADTDKKYEEGYMFYRGTEGKQQRAMDLRYLRAYHENIRRNREEVNQIQVAHEWAKRKARIAKDMQRKLQEMKFRPEFSFSQEPAPPQERIAPQDELKYGFTTALRSRPRSHHLDLALPSLGSTPVPFEEKSIRRDRINSLRSKFGRVLNLAEHEDRQAAPSLCQFSSRRRGLSEIIRNHSHSRQRLEQLEEVGRIKEKLTKAKVSVNMKALSRGLCLPENEDFFSQTTREFPNKLLPSNPDLVETKKKKKKK